jgi:hypothetical protein
MNFASIDDFLAHLARLPGAVQAAQRRGEEAAGKDLVRHAQAMIGTEDEGWAALAASTVAEKERKGWTGRVSATDPLYAEGGYRLSFGFRIDEKGLLWGTTDPVAPFLEYGTMRMPARPVVGSVMFVHGHGAANLVAGHLIAAMTGRSPPQSQIGGAGGE